MTLCIGESKLWGVTFAWKVREATMSLFRKQYVGLFTACAT